MGGGEDFDNRVIQHLIKVFQRKHGNSAIAKDKRAIQKLRREVERAKRSLSTQHQVRVEIESLFDGVDFAETLTRALRGAVHRLVQKDADPGSEGDGRLRDEEVR